MRDRDQMTSLFANWNPLAPGLVYGPQWRPDPTDPPVDDPASYITFAAAAVKP